MTFSHFLWAFTGFLVGGGYLWVYHILKIKGFHFFWYHPLLAGVVLMATLLIMETLFASLEEWQIQANWWFVLFIGVPLALLSGILLYRGITSKG